MKRAASPQPKDRAGSQAAEAALDRGLLAAGVGPRVRLLRNLLTQRVVAAFAPFGLRSGAFSTLALIAANPGCSQNDLARELALDKSGMVAIVDELERKGLASRARPSHDRRRHALSLTPEGEGLMREMHVVVSGIEQPIHDALTAQERALLFTLLDRAYAALAAANPEAPPGR